MTRIALIFGVGFGLFSYCALARPSYLLNDTTDQEKQQCINILSASGLSYEGQTDEGNRYDLYAIKMKKEWVFIVWDGDDPYSFRPGSKSRRRWRRRWSSSTRSAHSLAPTVALRRYRATYRWPSCRPLARAPSWREKGSEIQNH